MRLLINKIEQVQPDDIDDTLIKVFGRTAENPSERKEVTAYGFRPYFYALEGEVRDRENELLRQGSIEEIQYGDYDSIEGEDLARIYVPKPQDTRDARDLFEETWNADVLFTNRFRIDTDIRAYAEVPDPPEGEDEVLCHWREIKPVDADPSDANPGGNTEETALQNISPRVVTFDIEVDDRADGFPEHGQERILSIVAHDNYSDELAAFIHAPEGRPGVEAPPEVDNLFVERQENEMVRAFVDWFNEKDPDLITGWNVDDFDVPYLLQRIEKLVGVHTNDLSSLGWAGFTSRGEPRIKGRTIYDLLEVYKKNSFTELRSYRLDNVAQAELGAEKIEFDGTFYELYRDDPRRFLEYNLRDVTLCVDINREAGVIEFRDVLRREVGVDFEDSYDNKDFVDMMCRRKLKEHGVVGPTRPAYGEEPDSDYEGAHVFDPYEGVAENVVGVDLASLYPYTMAMLNASPETKAPEPKGDSHTLQVEGDGGLTNTVQVARADNGQHFRLDKAGLFKELVDDAIALKSDYKEHRDAAESDEEYEKWSEKYNVAKTLTNCFTPDTEVLTPNGVARIIDLSVGDVVYSLNPDTGEMGEKEVTHTHAYPEYSGELIDIQNHSTDFSVTPNHRMLVRRRTGYVSEDEYSFMEVGELEDSGGYEVPHGWSPPGGEDVTSVSLSSFLDGEEYERDGQQIREPRANCKWNVNTYNGDDFLELLAWYITEGSIYTSEEKEYNRTTRGVSTTINIAQETPEHRERIRTLLDRLGMDYYESETNFQITGHGTLAAVLEKLGGRGSSKKRIPDLVFDASPQQKERFFEILQFGDGDATADRYTTKSRQLRDNVMQLCVETGRSPQYCRDSGVWRVYWDTGKSFRMGRDNGTSTADNGVYCVTVADNHTLLAGRNGKFQPVGQSIYGVTGWERFFLYDEEVAEAVTLTGQAVIKRTAEYVESQGYEVLYGDTDSTYVKFPDEWDQSKCLDVAMELCDELNKEVYPAFAEEHGIPAEDNLWQIEVEAHMERFFQAGKKKRYAYVATWKDGRQIDEPKPTITGFSSKRSDSSQLTTDTEKAVLDAILSGEEDKVHDIVSDAADAIDPRDPDWERIGIPGGMNKKITDNPEAGGTENYYAVSSGDYNHPQDAQPRAAWNANHVLATDFGIDDKPMRVYLNPTFREELDRKIDVIAYETKSEIEQIEDEIMIDVSRMLDTTLRRPLDEILSAIGVDVDAAVRGQQQTGLGAFSVE